VCVLVYACTHTQTTWVLDVSPGVGRTPGEPGESRSTKAQREIMLFIGKPMGRSIMISNAQYTCRPYRCTQYICLFICCAAGFDDLG